MVVSTSRQASQVGIDILNKGGNAVDAAVAVGFTLAVTSSSNGNIGVAVLWLLDLKMEKPLVLIIEKWRLKQHLKISFLILPEMLLMGNLQEHTLHRVSPGSVDGLLKAWKDHGSGTISIEQLIGPAINFAENGFKLSHYEANRFNNRKAF